MWSAPSKASYLSGQDRKNRHSLWWTFRPHYAHTFEADAMSAVEKLEQWGVETVKILQQINSFWQSKYSNDEFKSHNRINDNID